MWFKIEKIENKIIESWLSKTDRKFLCLQNTTWEQTAEEIADCLKYAKDSEFYNVFSIKNNQPAIALMMGVESSGTVLHIYNIVVNPEFRNQNLAKKAIREIVNRSFFIPNSCKTIKATIVPDNANALKLFKSLNFANPKIVDNMIEVERGFKKLEIEQTK